MRNKKKQFRSDLRRKWGYLALKKHSLNNRSIQQTRQRPRSEEGTKTFSHTDTHNENKIPGMEI